MRAILPANTKKQTKVSSSPKSTERRARRSSTSRPATTATSETGYGTRRNTEAMTTRSSAPNAMARRRSTGATSDRARCRPSAGRPSEARGVGFANRAQLRPMSSTDTAKGNAMVARKSVSGMSNRSNR